MIAMITMLKMKFVNNSLLSLSSYISTILKSLVSLNNEDVKNF